jgi:hypothetical protein
MHGPRLYVAGNRVPHGLVGAWLLALGLGATTIGVALSMAGLTAAGAGLAQIGLVLAMHDLADWPWPRLDAHRTVRTTIPDPGHWLGEDVDPRDTTTGDW